MALISSFNYFSAW